MNKKLGKNGLFFWLFLAPVLIALIMVVVIPLLYGVYYSFTNWDGINTPVFAGITNYIQLLGDEGFRNALWFTTKFAVVSIVLINAIGLGLALLVTQKLKGSNENCIFHAKPYRWIDPRIYLAVRIYPGI